MYSSKRASDPNEGGQKDHASTHALARVIIVPKTRWIHQSMPEYFWWATILIEDRYRSVGQLWASCFLCPTRCRPHRSQNKILDVAGGPRRFCEKSFAPHMSLFEKIPSHNSINRNRGRSGSASANFFYIPPNCDFGPFRANST